ncbi:GNAT family N-acetyltransferase [Streptomyces sp. NBC_00503]|uniref:GNAT family N-acetyltransferase n=1 Tax=Streptomyces sp. NBC_00503 TaxID=2903659 RepID=UPI002E813A16|nr:GNAT family N-acetyltransferase [Streptomyces sp. NBC_00503]WUD85090.1 GNAT family N-acetyltransferase [Streptomyces sp. NBC_00503]
MAKLRPARATEAEALTELVMRSKAHWGYDADFLAACAPELRIDGAEVVGRRIVVAEGPAVLGLASLDGEPPLGRLGLLFVEPAAIGRGVGRQLYRDVLRRAAALGFRRLLIDSDPHAAGFYRAQGARRVDAEDPAGLVRFEVSPAPLADWARNWTGGGSCVHVGNVAEYNVQFADASLDREQRTAHHYACLAAFYGPRPAALVLPLAVPPGWIALVGRQLGWSQEPGARVEVYDGLAERDSGLSDAVRDRPALAALLTGAGLTLVPWGLTAPFARLVGRPWRPRELRYESKSAAHGLFGRILAEGGHPGIVLPAQWRADTRRAAVRLLAARAGVGESTVLKSEHGVGGSGTTVVTPERVRAAGGARAVLRGIPRGPLLVEEYVCGPADREEPRDLTYDGFVDPRGRVHEVGGAVMDVADGGYRGATVGPGVVPEWAQKPLLAFGEAVGRELSAAGYRGWFDIDFVADGTGRLAPTETNLRLTGPSVAFMVAARLDELRGAGHLVRICDRVELGARLPEAAFDELCERLAARCAELGAVFVPAIPTGAFEPAPWMGVLVAASDARALDAAEALVRAQALAVGAMFDGAGPDGSGPDVASGQSSGSGSKSKALRGGWVT